MLIIEGVSDKKIDKPGTIAHQDTVVDTWANPTTAKGRELIPGWDPQTDQQLLNIMWNTGLGLTTLDTIGYHHLKQRLGTHFRGKSGQDLHVNMPLNFWKSTFINNLDLILRQIEYKVATELYKNPNKTIIKVDNVINQAKISFRVDVFNPLWPFQWVV